MPDEPPVSDTATPTSTPAAPLPAPDVDPGYSSSGVPTYESVREKIEGRYATSLGSAELDAETPEGRTAEEQYEERQRAAAERLAQIRESMKPGHNDS
jgi:phage shock protein A